jgi:hypothetical protein
VLAGGYFLGSYGSRVVLCLERYPILAQVVFQTFPAFHRATSSL